MKIIPTLEQEAIINSTSQFNFIMAGAGCGKTSTLIQLLKKNNGLNFNYCTFTNEMLAEVTSKIVSDTQLLSPSKAKEYIYNFNSAGYRLLGKFMEVNNFEFKRVFLEEFELFNKVFLSQQQRENVWNSVTNYKKEYTKIHFENLTNTISKEASEILDKVFEIVWKKHKVCEFVDMEIWFYQALERDGIDFKKINFFLVDEFQDLDINKFYILKMIIKKLLDTNPSAVFYFVGDYNQQIYGWREQGDSNYFKKTMDYIKTISDDINILPLSKCFRCDTKLVNQLNQLLEQNYDKGFGYNPMTPHIDHQDQDKSLECITHTWNEFEPHLIMSLTKDYRENLITTRNNKNLLPIQVALFKHKIPYRVFGSNSMRFFEREAWIPFALAIYWRYKQSPEWNYQMPIPLLEKIFYFVLNSNGRINASKKDIPFFDRLEEVFNIYSLNNFLFDLSPENQTNLNSVPSNVIEKMLKPKEVEILKDIIIAMKILIQTTIKNIHQKGLSYLFETANFKNTQNEELQLFKNFLLTSDYSNWVAQIYAKQNVVGISSIHSSKGLEADNVIVCFNEDTGFKPNQEEVRVNYVAFSRAKKTLKLFAIKPNSFFHFMSQTK